MNAENFMQQALDLAVLANGNTHTNPMVGAVVVHDNKIIGQGFHAKFGAAHAEVVAIDSVVNKSLLAEATLYVSLEPCAHQGKTAACTNKILQSTIKQVVVAQLDPNPLVAGKGVALLRSHGVSVKVGLLQQQAEQLNAIYNYAHRQQRPFVCLKYASSLNGKGSISQGQTTAITGAASLADLYQQRKKYQSILIGSNTQIIDDPILTVRDDSYAYQPIRVVIDRRLRIKPNARLITDASASTWIFSCVNPQQRPELNNLEHVKIFFSDEWSPAKVLAELYKQGVQSVMVEGGGAINLSFLQQQLANEIMVYMAPVIFLGDSVSMIATDGLPSCKYVALEIKSMQQIGVDYRFIATPMYRCLGER